MHPSRRLLVRWLLPNVTLIAGLVLLLGLSEGLGGRPFRLGAYSSIQVVLTTNAAALASTLSILMAIVLLMVQLTAQRYSFNIIGMFVQNPRNVALVAFFILTISFNLWLAASIEDGYIPQVGTYLALAMGTLCFGLLVPYLGFLFDSLTPRNLLDALQRETLAAIDTARYGYSLEQCRRVAADRVQHTGDITRTAISLADADVARHSVWVLHGIFCAYLAAKRELPRGWYAIEDRFFRGRHALILQQIEASGTWFERRLLEEYQSAFTSSLNRLETVNTTVALCCRLAGERALELGDDAALELLIKFFNTYLRAALNARDARAGYHLLHQYELLADAAFEARPEITLEIAHRIAYYGESALGMSVLWMAIAAAQDLRSLAEVSIRRGLPDQTTARLQDELILLVGLATRQAPAAASLLQKAALALGAFHLANDKGDLASALARSLALLSASTWEQHVAELEAVIEPQFWELTDWVLNFEFVEESARARLRDFQAMIDTQNVVMAGATWA